MTAVASMDELSRAAVMVMLLEENQAAKILSALEPEELLILGQKMSDLGTREMQPEYISNAIAGFVSRSDHVSTACKPQLEIA